MPLQGNTCLLSIRQCIPGAATALYIEGISEAYSVDGPAYAHEYGTTCMEKPELVDAVDQDVVKMWMHLPISLLQSK